MCARMCARSKDLIFRMRLHFLLDMYFFLFTGKLAFHLSAFRTKDLSVSMKTRTERRSTLLTLATFPQAHCIQCLAAYNCKISRLRYTCLSADYWKPCKWYKVFLSMHCFETVVWCFLIHNYAYILCRYVKDMTFRYDAMLVKFTVPENFTFFLLLFLCSYLNILRVVKWK